MASVEEKIKTGGGMIVGGQTLAAEMKLLKEMTYLCGLNVIGYFQIPWFKDDRVSAIVKCQVLNCFKYVFFVSLSLRVAHVVVTMMISNFIFMRADG